MFRASSFKLTMYENCPLQYKFTYVDHIADQYKKPKPYLTMGAHVHNALKDFYEQVDPIERDWEVLESMLRKRWTENRKGFISREDEKNWGTKALQMLKQYVYKNDVTKDPVMLEDYYDVDLTEDVKVIGRIDRVDKDEEGLHVIDYKTGAYNEDDISDIQLILYAMIVQANRKEPVYRASFLYLASNQWYSLDISDDMFEDIGAELLDRVEQIKKDQQMLPTINKYCKNCDFLEICPKKNEIEKLIEAGEL
ncbi:MAG: PD-(D/E)XK nuclease family protein [bacterium]|nr:PD-(D/E)XK nuclease family protein [bacterium]